VTVLAFLQGALRIGVVLLCLGVAAGWVRLALAAQDDRGLARRALAIAAALLFGAGVVAAGFGAAGQAPGWLAWLRLPAEAALPVLALLLLGATRNRLRAAGRAALASPFDAATDLPRWPHALRQMVPALARCRREGTRATLLAVAIDRGAALRATRGPASLAAALRDLGAVLRAATRASDLPGHLEPEVLGVLLVGTAAGDAPRIADRIRALARERLPDPDMDGRRLGVSLGFAEVGDGVEAAALEEARSAALAALAAAQAAGGDRREAAPPPLPRRTGLGH
jgi:GGDEF domain-containing protein